MKPFDLQKALAGEPVVTRDGRKVLKIIHWNFDFIDEENKLSAVIENNSFTEDYSINGKYYSGEDSNHDLFMAPVKKTYWMNVYMNPFNGTLFGNELHKTKEEALEKSFINVIQTISFEVEL